MTVLGSWDTFKAAAERLYLEDPNKTRYVLKYNHNEGMLMMKMTNDKVCLQYKTESQQDVKNMEKFVNELIRLMASKDNQ